MNKGILASWTQLYKPISVVETLMTTNKFDEDK